MNVHMVSHLARRYRVHFIHCKPCQSLSEQGVNLLLHFGCPTKFSGVPNMTVNHDILLHFPRDAMQYSRLQHTSWSLPLSCLLQFLTECFGMRADRGCAVVGRGLAEGNRFLDGRKWILRKSKQVSDGRRRFSGQIWPAFYTTFI